MLFSAINNKKEEIKTDWLIDIHRFTSGHAPEELKVQASFGQEELVVLLKPHLAHGRVLQDMSYSLSDCKKVICILSYANKLMNIELFKNKRPEMKRRQEAGGCEQNV